MAPILPALGVGARPAGMGDNFVGLADDVHASAWNPARLAFVPETSASFMYLNLFNLINYDALSFAVPAGERGGWGGHILYAYTDAIPQTTEDAGGNFNPSGGGTFRNSDLKANVSGGYALTPIFSVGAGGSVFQDAVGNDTVTGFFGDFGAFLKHSPLVHGVRQRASPSAPRSAATTPLPRWRARRRGFSRTGVSPAVVGDRSTPSTRTGPPTAWGSGIGSRASWPPCAPTSSSATPRTPAAITTASARASSSGAPRSITRSARWASWASRTASA